MLKFSNFFPPEVFTLISDRSVNFTLPKAGDHPFGRKQKQFLISRLKKFATKVVNIRQIHGRRIILGTPQYLKRNRIVEADGIVTNVPNLPVAVRTADCLSVFIYDPRHKAIGVVHAGWKGTKKKIISNEVRLMKKKFGSQAADLKVAFGPSIQSCCYQVGQEFKRHFPKEVVKKSDGLYLDLPRVNKLELLGIGVKARNILESDICTFCNNKFFSFRREKERAGRMISIMMLKG